MTEVSFPVEMVDGAPVVTAPEEVDITNADGLRAALLDAAGRGAAGDGTRAAPTPPSGFGALGA